VTAVRRSFPDNRQHIVLTSLAITSPRRQNTPHLAARGRPGTMRRARGCSRCAGHPCERKSAMPGVDFLGSQSENDLLSARKDAR
jgi:hypothetical protein